MLCIHDVGRSWQDFSALMPTLAARRGVIAADLKGHGHSGPSALPAICDTRLTITRPTLVGSWLRFAAGPLYLAHGIAARRRRCSPLIIRASPGGPRICGCRIEQISPHVLSRDGRFR